MKYFKWKDKYRLYSYHPGCQLCAKLYDDNQPVKVMENLSSWFMNGTEGIPQCTDGTDRNYYDSMMSIAKTLPKTIIMNRDRDKT